MIRNWAQTYGKLSIMYEDCQNNRKVILKQAKKPPVIDMPSNRWYI